MQNEQKLHNTTFSTNTEVRGFTSYGPGAVQDPGAGQACSRGNHYSVADLAKESWIFMCSRHFTFEIGSEWWVSMQTCTEEASKPHSLCQWYLKSRASEVMGWANKQAGSSRSDSLLGFGSAELCVCRRLLLVLSYCGVWGASQRGVGWGMCVNKMARLAQSLLSAYALGGLWGKWCLGADWHAKPTGHTMCALCVILFAWLGR